MVLLYQKGMLGVGSIGHACQNLQAALPLSLRSMIQFFSVLKILFPVDEYEYVECSQGKS